MQRVFSAGGIVVKKVGGKKKVLVAQHSGHKGWDFPKGHIEKGETSEEAAIREVEEETGWDVKNIKLIKIIDIPNRPNEDRQNISFVHKCQAVKKTGKADKESSEQKWFNLSSLPPKEQFAFDHLEDIKFYLKSKNR